MLFFIKDVELQGQFQYYLNTSHVILYQVEPNGAYASEIEFKYISCYSLSTYRQGSCTLEV